MDKLLREMTNILDNLSKAPRNQYKSISHIRERFTEYENNFSEILNSLEKMNQHDEGKFRDILVKPVLPNKNTFLHDICSRSFDLIASQKDDEAFRNEKIDFFQRMFISLIEKMKKYGIKSSGIKNKDGLNIDYFIDSYVENIANSMDLDETDEIMMDIMPEMEEFKEHIADLDESAKSWKASTAKSGKASAAKERKRCK